MLIYIEGANKQQFDYIQKKDIEILGMFGTINPAILEKLGII